jgi:hypothetical protein
MGGAYSTHKRGEECVQNFDWETEGKRSLGRPRRRLGDNIRMGLREIGWEDVDWMYLAEDRDQWRALVTTTMNLRGRYSLGDP